MNCLFPRAGSPSQRRMNRGFVVSGLKGPHSGFTLIETLMVIAIIAILVALLICSLRFAREQARATVCRSNQRSIGISVALYLQDHAFRLANISEANGFFWIDREGTLLSASEPNAYWGVAYDAYVENRGVFGCPSFRPVTKLIYPDDPILVRQAAFGNNSFISHKKVPSLIRAAEVIVAHDHAEPKLENGPRDMFYNSGPGTTNLTMYRAGGARAEFYCGIFRHQMRYGDDFCTGGRANILWLDGHVSTLLETTGDDVLKRWYIGKP